jgi:hypothetical protein
LPITGELLRGSLLERTVAQQRMPEMRARRTASSVCITVTYAEGRTRQFTVRRERATEVRRWLSNYQQLLAEQLSATEGGDRGHIEMRRKQLSFGDGLIAKEVSDLREEWMTQADEVVADEGIIAAVYEALAKRHPKSRCRGRRGAPADRVLRLLLLKHIRNWIEVLEREVRANWCTRTLPTWAAARCRTPRRWGAGSGAGAGGAQASS